jgi:hypothetical protein
MIRKDGVGSLIAVNLLNLAMVAIGRGSADRAREIVSEALQIAAQIGSKPARRNALDVAVGLAGLLEDWRRAARTYGAAQLELEQTGVRRETADDVFISPWVAKARAALGESAFGAAEAEGRALAFEESVAETRAWLKNAT